MVRTADPVVVVMAAVRSATRCLLLGGTGSRIAMLLPSFEEYLYVDADFFSVYNPDILFKTPPFTAYGLV